MKKSDLPWILPLLAAVADGKTIQFREPDGPWQDWDHDRWPLPSFSNAKGAYRIKPELKTPFEVYTQKTYPNYTGVWGPSIIRDVTEGLNAVIRAYKAGDLELPDDLK